VFEKHEGFLFWFYSISTHRSLKTQLSTEDKETSKTECFEQDFLFVLTSAKPEWIFFSSAHASVLFNS